MADMMIVVNFVALSASAWIETFAVHYYDEDSIVALFASAWIETLQVIVQVRSVRSHSLRVRGLKQNVNHVRAVSALSHSLRVRGLKLVTVFLACTLSSRTLCECVD